MKGSPIKAQWKNDMLDALFLLLEYNGKLKK